MIRIIRRENPLIKPELQEIYEDFLTYAFANQNERLSNSLKKLFTYNQFIIMSKNLNFDIKANASGLNIDQWLGLFDTFLTKVSSEKAEVVKGYKTKFDLSFR